MNEDFIMIEWLLYKVLGQVMTIEIIMNQRKYNRKITDKCVV